VLFGSGNGIGVDLLEFMLARFFRDRISTQLLMPKSYR